MASTPPLDPNTNMPTHYKSQAFTKHLQGRFHRDESMQRFTAEQHRQRRDLAVSGGAVLLAKTRNAVSLGRKLSRRKYERCAERAMRPRRGWVSTPQIS